MTRPPSWYTERRTKAALASGGDSQSLAQTSITDETSTLSGGRRNTRRAFISNHQIDEDIADDDEEEVDDGLPGAYAITRSTENDVRAADRMEWDPTEHTQPPQEDLSSGASEGRSMHCSPGAAVTVITRTGSNISNNDPKTVDAQAGGPRWLHNQRRWLVTLGAALCIAGVAVVVTLVVLVTAEANNNQGQVANGNPTPDPCDYDGQSTQVDPFIQCECEQAISLINDDVLAQYETNLNYLADAFEDGRPLIDSCSAENMALVWISAQVAEEKAKGIVMRLDRIRTRFTLALLYTAWEGESWIGRTNWVTNNLECEWWGITCNEDVEVIALELRDNNVIGTLDTRIGILKDLRLFDLVANRMTGTIPLEVWSIPNLETLLMDRNEITGEIPAVLGAYSTSLKNISLVETRLEGPLPSLSGLDQLQELKLTGSSSISGSIPEDWGELVQLEHLSLLRVTGISGWLPDSFSLLTNLKVLEMGYSTLGGTIPAYLEGLSLLERFDATAILQGGTIPSFLGVLTNLAYIELSQGSLTGTIPAELSACTKLKSLFLSGNSLDGTLPPAFGTMSNLEQFGVGFNVRLTGPVPVEYANLKKLTTFDISSTSLTGALPRGLCENPFLSITDGGNIFPDCTCCTLQEVNPSDVDFTP